MAKRRKNSRREKVSNIDLQVVIMIITGILLAILIYTKSGVIGEHLSPILGGILGWIKYIVPIGTFAIAIYLVYEDKNYLSSKILKYIIFLLCISIIMSIYQSMSGQLSLKGDYWQIVKEGYTLGERNVGGGAVGTMIAIPLTSLLGNWGAIVLTIGLTILLLILIFGMKPSEILKRLIEKHKENKEKRKTEKLEKMNELKIKDKSKILLGKEPLGQVQIDDIHIHMKENETEIDKVGILGFNKKKDSQQPNYIEDNLFKKQEEQKEDKTKEVLVLQHALTTAADENYEFPPIEFLKEATNSGLKGGKKAVADIATKLQKTLYSFGVSAKVENVSVGPAITRYELKPAEGVRVSKIANLAEDIALNLAAESIRIEAPIPGKQAVGIEIPNKEKEIVPLRDIISSDKFINAPSKLAFALGKDVAGEVMVADIGKMPHVLIAGSTGSGKSVCINTLVASIIYKAKPSEVKLVMIDPKVVELSVYNGIPHLLIPVVTDPKKAAGALAWAVQEMVNRYSLFATKGVRDIEGYNRLIEGDELEGKLPKIVIIIDELADLMMVSKNEVEDAICRLAQMARAAGMHLVIATQRPSVDVITGLIKANIPTRISFAVSSQIDSRTILDMAGAEKLLGKGDMLFNPIEVLKPIRIQGGYISDKEVEKIVDFLKSNGEVKYNEDIMEKIENNNKTEQEMDADEDNDADPFLMEAIETVVDTGQASTSFIQRRFKVGYARAGRMIDQMEQRGVISGYEGSKPRQVLWSRATLDELKMAKTEDVDQ